MLAKFICSRDQRYLLSSLTPDKGGWDLFLGQRKEKTGQYFLQALLGTIIMRPLFDYNRKCSSHYLVNILNACGYPMEQAV